MTARTPIADMAQPYNLTFLHSNFYIKENIDLICRMTPDIKNFIFIGDERQNNQTYNMVIKQELKKSHPDINYQFISPRKMQTNHLLDTLYTVDPKTTGILFSSWFYKHTFAGNTSLVTNSHPPCNIPHSVAVPPLRAAAGAPSVCPFRAAGPPQEAPIAS